MDQSPESEEYSYQKKEYRRIKKVNSQLKKFFAFSDHQNSSHDADADADAHEYEYENANSSEIDGDYSGN